MPSFSQHSLDELNTLHPDLQLVLRVAILFIDFRILEGHRDEARQNRLRAEGKSQLSFPNSKHNSLPSRAVDIAPWPVDWQDTERFVYFAGWIMGIAHSFNIPLRWGGDWDQDTHVRDENFRDFGHFELTS